MNMSQNSRRFVNSEDVNQLRFEYDEETEWKLLYSLMVRIDEMRNGDFNFLNEYTDHKPCNVCGIWHPRKYECVKPSEEYL
jgi:arylamine N-acetyltransferase